jgi:hypothetical protein
MHRPSQVIALNCRGSNDTESQEWQELHMDTQHGTMSITMVQSVLKGLTLFWNDIAALIALTHHLGRIGRHSMSSPAVQDNLRTWQKRQQNLFRQPDTYQHG